jgi:acyl-CoA synthetase (AMP-forming)/AMP-acid ligase II
MFEAQVRLIRNTYGIEPGEVDLAVLPVFALFNPALGMTTVVPELDPSKPAAADPARLVQAIRQNGVTNSFGSPVIWSKIARHCVDNRITISGVRRILMAGAPVPPPLFELMRQVFPGAGLYSPYGATEALPVSSISAEDVLGTVPRTRGATDAVGSPNVGRQLRTDVVANPIQKAANYAPEGTAAATLAGRGTCVGRTIAEMTAKIIAIAEGPISTLAEARELPNGQIGEIIVRGPVVTTAYDLMPEPTARAKILETVGQLEAPAGTFPLQQTTGGTVWHRMGDAGYIDESGRLWFCGRLAERVETSYAILYPDCVEPIFNVHPHVRRTALIGFGPRSKQVAALAVECWPSHQPKNAAAQRALGRELRELGSAYPHTNIIRLFHFVDAFPVDVRHNAKIHRLKLARSLAGQPGMEFDKR